MEKPPRRVNEVQAAKILTLILAAILAQRFLDWTFLAPLTLALIGFLAISYLWSKLSLRSVGLTRLLESDRLQVGQTVRDRIRVANTSRIATLWLEVLDYSTLPGHTASRVIHVAGRGVSEWSQETVCTRRGQFRTGPAMLHSGDPFGIFPTTRRMAMTHEVLVYPATFDVSGFILPAGQLIGSSSVSRRNPFVTPSVTGVREYVQGDALNRISWTTSARLGRLMVKEFDLDPTADLWIVLDMERLHHRVATVTEGPERVARAAVPWLDSTEEYAVAIAASLARRALDDGRSVGLVASANRTTVINPDRSERQVRRVLEHLATVHADGVRPLHEVLTGESFRFRRQSALVVVTPSPNEGWTHVLAGISSRRVPCGAIAVEGSTFGAAESSLLAVGGLLAHGIQTHIIKYGDDISVVLRSQPRGVHHRIGAGVEVRGG